MSEDTAVVEYQPKAKVGSVGTLQSLIAKPWVQNWFMDVVPKHFDGERLLKIVLSAASRQPELMDCTQESLLRAIFTSAELGISCSGLNARGYLIPRWNGKIKALEANFQTGYGGLIDVICEPGGSVSHVEAEVVFKEDKFRLALGVENTLEHERPATGKRIDDNVVGAYAIFFMRGGGHMIQYMSREEIDEVRDNYGPRNRDGKLVGPWTTNYRAMCRKTPVRHGANYVPMSKEQQRKIERLDEAEGFGQQLPFPSSSIDLKPTSGREKWGEEPPVDVPPGDFGFHKGEEPPPPEEPPAEHEVKEQPKPEPKSQKKPTSKPKESQAVVELKALLAERTAGWRDEERRQLRAEMFSHVGIAAWSGVDGENVFDACVKWIEEHAPEKE